ncbi:MAG: CvpA family protein [Alistipes sp.]
MNGFDLIFYLVLVLAVWDGWRRGVVLQLCSLAGLFVGIWLAGRYDATVGAWMQLDGTSAAPAGFVVTLLSALIAMAIVGHLLRKLFHFVGFGIPDNLLGVAVSVVKYLLLLSVLCSAFDSLNAKYAFVEQPAIEKSRWYRPVKGVSDHIFPFIHFIGEHLPTDK